MEPTMHRSEIREPLLDEHVGSANGRVARELVVFVESCPHDATRCVYEKAQKFEQNWGWGWERQWQVCGTDIVLRQRSLHLSRLCWLCPYILAPGGRPAF